jgi:hypothetical protein
MMWHIWDARNKLYEEGIMAHPNSVAAKVKAYVEMILVHLYKPIPNHRRESSSSTAKWTSPPVGTVLLNVDATIFSDTRRMGAGVVARDHTGAFLAGLGERYDNVVIPEVAEALAVCRAVSFAQEESFTKIIIGTDCLSVTQRLRSAETDRSLLGPVIEDIKSMSRTFVSCEFRHVYRVLNVVAHQLARSSESYVSRVWRGVPPSFIQEAICNDYLIMDQ